MTLSRSHANPPCQPTTPTHHPNAIHNLPFTHAVHTFHSHLQCWLVVQYEVNNFASPDTLLPAFTALDADKGGTITVDELMSAVGNVCKVSAVLIQEVVWDPVAGLGSRGRSGIVFPVWDLAAGLGCLGCYTRSFLSLDCELSN